MMRHRTFRVLAASLLPIMLHAQSRHDTTFCNPLDLPSMMAATFGELRPNHFHSGLDYRTGGSVGHPVRAVADGYVSRIKVDAIGYGNALYITHHNGYTTVYGHLDAYSKAITDYLRRQQYSRQSFALDIYPDSTLLPVSRGEIVAFSGNTGGSSGPHLHFEVRETASEYVVNPLLFGFNIPDTQAPVIRRLAVVPVGENSAVNGAREMMVVPVEHKGSHYTIARRLEATGDIAFAIDAFDRLSGTDNKCGLYRLCLQVDGDTIFLQTMNRFAFDDTRYINSLIDYDYWTEHRVMFNRMFVEPNNRLRFVYNRLVNRGIVTFAEAGDHNVTVTAADLQGNRSRLSFPIRYTPSPPSAKDSLPSWMQKPDFLNHTFTDEQSYHYRGAKVTIPANALYSPFVPEIALSPTLADAAANIHHKLYSPVYNVQDRRVPLHKPITVAIAADSLPVRLRDKALIVQVGNKGQLNSAGGTFDDNKVTSKSFTFGNFAIGVDTVPPTIRPINIKNGSNMRGKQDMRFRISDNLSGIAVYRGLIDGRWALFEFDAKRRLLTYTFDPERLQKNTRHQLRLEVIDAKGNSTVFEASFTW